MNLKVIKKDGSKMDFDKNKIINAIMKDNVPKNIDKMF